MNFLAHLYLSENKEHLMVGNFLADYLNNKQVAELPRPIQEGIRMHRKIDSYTDQHPSVREGVVRLRPFHGKFAPVVLDICYDYVLAKNWDKYSDVDLNSFTAGVYKVLDDHILLMPNYLQERLPKMIADNWLVKYGSLDGLRFTFERMKMRTKYPQYFDGAVEHFMDEFEFFQDGFYKFFPDLIASVANWEQRSE